MELADGIVRAAGGLVVRDSPDSGLEVLLVHRPKYDDWTFPKGKAEPGETDEDCALREVEEETGLRCALGPALPSVSYTDSRGRPKVVRYFRMWSLAGAFAPHGEVDDARWLPVDGAAGLLTYEHDRDLLEALADDDGAGDPGA